MTWCEELADRYASVLICLRIVVCDELWPAVCRFAKATEELFFTTMLTVVVVFIACVSMVFLPFTTFFPTKE